jgi:formylglycine-generating enzyme required for sulfatase activity
MNNRIESILKASKPSAWRGSFCDKLAGGVAGPEMVWLPAGAFRMGGSEVDEQPEHEVKLKRFAISRYPVTFSQYDQFVRSGAWNPPPRSWWPASLPPPARASRSGLALPPDQGWGRGEQPVIHVTWHEAVAFTEWLSEQTGHNYRLPTEAEWEYAARAGSETAYCFGDDTADLREYAWFAENSSARAWPVGRKKANPWGVHDMHGNVWEWTSSVYRPRYEGQELHNVQHSYVGGELLVARGGCWMNKADWLRSSLRYWYPPDYQSAYLGFRVARA